MIAVLGGSGFLGTHVCAILDDFEIPYIIGSRRYGIDATNLVQLLDWTEKHSVDSIINLAAECGGIGLNKEKPLSLWLATSRILTNVFEVCSKNRNIKKLTTVGTVCSYAADCPTPFKEEDLFHHGMPEITNSAYGISKLSGLTASYAIRRQYGLNSIFLLSANMYGPRDHFDEKTSHVIPALIKKCKDAIDNNSVMTCWGSGKPTREFLYVHDAAYGIIKAHQEYNKPEPINLGTGIETPIAWITTTICDIMGYKGQIKWDTSKPDGQNRRCLDISKAKKEFGFEACTNLKDGLKQTIEWYLDYINCDPNALKLLRHYENGVITEHELLNRFAEKPEQKLPIFWRQKVNELVFERNSPANAGKVKKF